MNRKFLWNFRMKKAGLPAFLCTGPHACLHFCKNPLTESYIYDTMKVSQEVLHSLPYKKRGDNFGCGIDIDFKLR